jgi:hypothetical protein
MFSFWDSHSPFQVESADIIANSYKQLHYRERFQILKAKVREVQNKIGVILVMCAKKKN